MQLRDYQQDAVNAVWHYLDTYQNTNPCVVIPTAGGKSLCIAQVASDAVIKRAGRVLCLAHVKELIEQNANKIRSLCPDIPVGIYSAGLKTKDVTEPIIVASIQSIYRNAHRFKPFDLVMIDEAHLINNDDEGRYRSVLNALKKLNPRVRFVGWTATPYRTKGGLICKPENILNEVCYEISVKELIQRGYISKLISKSGAIKPDITRLHIRAGEFVQEDIDAVMGESAIVSNACREIVELTRERKTCLIFCTSIKHCTQVAELITRFSGEECAIVTGDTPSEERANILSRMRGETIKVGLFNEELKPLKYCCNVSVLTTGTDIPNIDTIALLRPTASPGLLVQMVGRGFRLSPATNKTECLVLDYGRNIERFGCIDQIKATEPRSNTTHETLAKECPMCHTMMHLAVMRCSECGYEFPQYERTESIENQASTHGIISGEETITEYDVCDVAYTPWTKRGAPPKAAQTVRVTYSVDLTTRFSEWICPEHTGYARRKFEAWWRTHSDVLPIPSTANEVCELAYMGAVRPTNKIMVKTVSGEKFPSIIDYELGELKSIEQPIEEPFDESVPF